MSEMVAKVAAALEQAFKDRVAATASRIELDQVVTFEQTGVTAPGFDVWEGYARAAIAAMREPTKAMEAAWDRDFDDWMEERVDEPMHMWMTLIDEALK